jgi:hypothetical protein
MEVLGNMATLPTLDHFQDAPEVRPLSSTGVTRLRWYYEPVRHPTRPGLSLAGVQLGGAPPTVGVSRVVSDLRVQACRRHYPGGTARACRSTSTDDSGLPPPLAGSAPTSDFSRPARRSHTLRPACSRGPQGTLSIEGSSSFVTSTAAPIATCPSRNCHCGSLLS